MKTIPGHLMRLRFKIRVMRSASVLIYLTSFIGIIFLAFCEFNIAERVGGLIVAVCFLHLFFVSFPENTTLKTYCAEALNRPIIRKTKAMKIYMKLKNEKEEYYKEENNLEELFMNIYVSNAINHALKYSMMGTILWSLGSSDIMEFILKYPFFIIFLGIIIYDMYNLDF